MKDKTIFKPYMYSILLAPDKIKGNYFSVTYKEGSKYSTKLIDSNVFELASQERLTQQQLLDMFDRTENIIGIRGDFAI